MILNPETFDLVNAEAEEAVLASMMLDERAAEVVVEEMAELDFYNPRHRILFRVLSEMFAQQMPMDELSVNAELKARNFLDVVG
jgi:replicative DNA helicase